MSKDNLRDLAAWDLERNKDYYPAGALDKNGCFYNGQIGNCGTECSAYLLDKCPIPDEIAESALKGEGE